MGWQIAATGALVFGVLVTIDLSCNGIPHLWKTVGGIAVLLVPIWLLIQIWQ